MMTRRDVFSEELFYQFSLESKVPKDHLLRKIKERVDFAFIYDLVEDKYSSTGAPSVDPMVIFKLMLIGYLYGIKSERQLMENASLNLAYLWFIDYKITDELPDHSIFTKIRGRLGKAAFIKFFHHVVKLCVAAGLTKGDSTYLDATLIDSKAANTSLRSRELVDQLKAESNRYIDALEWPRKEAKPALSAGAKLNRRLVSPKDSQAQITTPRKGQKSRLAYKGHIAVDGAKARIVTACALTGGAYPEEHLLWELASAHEQITQTPLRYLGADSRYYTADNLLFLKAKRIMPAIPARKERQSIAGGFCRDDFYYNQEENCFICPAGKKLTPSPSFSKSRFYRAKMRDCNHCRLKAKCISGKAKRKTIMISKYEKLFSWAKDFLFTPTAKQMIKLRKVYPETVFAHAKSFHGLTKAKFKGRWKVEIQLLMTMAAMNLKKLVKYSQDKPVEAAGNCNAVLKNKIFSHSLPIFSSLFLSFKF